MNDIPQGMRLRVSLRRGKGEPKSARINLFPSPLIVLVSGIKCLEFNKP
jgi:hypothetical protein